MGRRDRRGRAARLGGAGDPARRGARRVQGDRVRPGRGDAAGVGSRGRGGGAGGRGGDPRPRRGAAARSPRACSGACSTALGEGFDGAVPGLRSSDTVKRARDGGVAETLDRATSSSRCRRRRRSSPQRSRASPSATSDRLRVAGRGARRPRHGRRGRRAAAQGHDARPTSARRGVAVEAVVFDVGETLVDETRMWERAAGARRRAALHVMGVLGGLAARGEHAQARLASCSASSARRGVGFENADLYADACRASTRLRDGGYASAPPATRPRRSRSSSGSTSTSSAPRHAGASRSPRRASSRASSRRSTSGRRGSPTWATASTTTSCPAPPPGMVAVHIRRGPWGYLHEPPAGAIRIRSLDELPAVLAGV